MTKGKAPVPQIEQDNTAQPNKQSQAPAGEPKIRVDVSADTADTIDAVDADEHPSEGDLKSSLIALFVGHEHAILGGIAGLVIAFLMFTIGFWKTLFITLLVVVGVAIGQLIDGDPKIINVLRRFIDALRSDD